MKHFQIPSFLINTVIYEVNLRQYTPEGTIRAFMHEIPRLHNMGVKIIWLMPIHPIGKIKRKGSLGSYYSISDYCDVNPEFGTKEDFAALVNLVHSYGMKIIIDWVANHTAWDNVWTKTNPDFFERDPEGNFKPPYDWDDVLQINHQNHEEQEAMLEAMKYWITDFDIDGFRADLAHLTPLPFWIKARTALNNVKADLIWLAETETPEYYQAFDIIYAWKWMHATEQVFKNHQPVKILKALLHKQQHEFPAHALQLYFTANHDENSWNGTEYEKYGIYAQALAVFSFTYRDSVPLIYSGQELPNFKRLKFFDKDAIDWNTKPELEGFYRILSYVHNNIDMNADCQWLPSPENVLAFSRTGYSNTLLVYLNLGEQHVSFQSETSVETKKFINVFTGEECEMNNSADISLAPGAYFIFQSK